MMNNNPTVVNSTTFLARKNALHLAAEEGHITVLSSILEALLCQVRSSGQLLLVHPICQPRFSCPMHRHHSWHAVMACGLAMDVMVHAHLCKPIRLAADIKLSSRVQQSCHWRSKANSRVA